MTSHPHIDSPSRHGSPFDMLLSSRTQCNINDQLEMSSRARGFTPVPETPSHTSSARPSPPPHPPISDYRVSPPQFSSHALTDTTISQWTTSQSPVGPTTQHLIDMFTQTESQLTCPPLPLSLRRRRTRSRSPPSPSQRRDLSDIAILRRSGSPGGRDKRRREL